MTKRIHTFTITDINHKTLKEIYGDYIAAKKETLQFLETLNPDTTIGFLWIYEDFYWSGKQYTGDCEINNVISQCGRNPMLTVKEIIGMMKKTNIDGTMCKQATFIPTKQEAENKEVLQELKDE